jgi:hypothetical protein
MQILHRFAGSIQRYSEDLSDPDRYRPDHCPQCAAQHPLRAHGFYTRTLVDIAFDGTVRIRRYLCCCCKRTASLLPEWGGATWAVWAQWTIRGELPSNHIADFNPQNNP